MVQTIVGHHLHELVEQPEINGTAQVAAQGTRLYRSHVHNEIEVGHGLRQQRLRVHAHVCAHVRNWSVRNNGIRADCASTTRRHCPSPLL